MEGKDAEGLPFAFIKSVEFKVEGQTVEKQKFNPRDPFQCLVPSMPRKLVVTLEFHSHYGEPQLDIPITANGGWSPCLVAMLIIFLYYNNIDAELEASLEYNPFIREWAIQRSDGGAEADLVAKLQAAKV